jgi:adenylyltransferase/sulfurtransferase
MLTKTEIERYSRQILLVGKENQNKIKQSRVLVIGAGGIGCGLLPYLVSSGVGYIRVIDPDEIEMSNLSRQVIYKPENIGALKGPTAIEYLQSLNPDIELEWNAGLFSPQTSNQYLQNIDLILEGSDDIHCKFLVSDISKKNKIAALIGSIGNTQGHIFPVEYKKEYACYRCLFDEPENSDEIPTCASEGILSPLPGIIGAMMAYITLNYFIDGSFLNKLYIMEKSGWRTIPFYRNTNCGFCSSVN